MKTKDKASLPLISICVINYNNAAYLSECISSIINQTYKNIELVFCDDASTDGSIGILENLVKNAKHIKLNRQYGDRNLGAEANMLRGLRAFTGEYVCNIDSDDMLADNHIEILFNVINQSKADIACTNHIEFKENENLNFKKHPGATFIGVPYVISTEKALETLFFKQRTLPFEYWHRLYGRAPTKIIATLPDIMFANSDSAFSMAQFCEAKTVAILDVPTYLYRAHIESMTRKSTYKLLKRKTLHSLDQLTDYYSAKNPFISSLNEYRNNKTILLILDACINEGNNFQEFLGAYKIYVTKYNRKIIYKMLREFKSRRKLHLWLIASHIVTLYSK